ncbi:hypothetical protein OEZ85_009668 [Tetradesmus obliquus]|uniref:Uncharacterized protein n=2 Tax=Tetradesmus obliquus TaxID=3088 RepID=A0A383VY00_TETOB|nr:hypothetical protein OEZ85_009668 [Tetradesmus obliquus]|eukprot:jgi/Sobl393_1/13053/SZX69800.1
MAQVGAPPLPQKGMGPPAARPHHAADPNRHRQHHQQHKGRPPGSSSGAAAGRHHNKQQAAAGRPSSAAAAAAAAQAGPPAPAVAADGTAELERLRRDTPFICNIRFKNDLPEIPSDPKLLVSSYEPDKLSRFFLTSIEQQPRRELLLPADVGVTISLMDLERYDVPPLQPGERRRLDPADEALLQDVDSLPAAGQAVSPLKVKRATKGQGPSWLMATTYLTSSQAGAGARAAAAAAGRFQPAQQQGELTREQQLADIEGTFIAAQQTPVHPTKPGLSVVSSVPILPDFDSWEDKYVTVSFEEGDPAQDSKALGQVRDPELRAALVSHCMIKSYQPQSGSEPAMGLLVPRAAAAAAAAGQALPAGSSAEELEGDYSWDCEYSFDLLTREGHKPHETLLLVMREDRVGYCQFDGQVKLRKRKRQPGDEPRPEKACIYNREFKPAELQERQTRQMELDAAQEDMYDEEEGVDEAGEEEEY